jgi:hypothetical protein
MRTSLIRSLSVSVLAVLLFAGTAAAQDKSPALLNSAELQQLVKRGEPADNARLAAHFTALAERYGTEAKRHTSMSQGFIGNPSRNLGAGLSAHCKRLATLNTQAATELRELATYHQKLAAGAAVPAPAAGGRFEAGAGAPKPTDQELISLAAKASTASDHGTLADYFTSLETRYTSEAADHTATAATSRGLPRNQGTAAAAAVHCERLATLSTDLAKEATAAAAMHSEHAKGSR